MKAGEQILYFLKYLLKAEALARQCALVPGGLLQKHQIRQVRDDHYALSVCVVIIKSPKKGRERRQKGAPFPNCL